jgi:aspartyl/asparaginyl-tRNA synthetase
MNKSLEWALLKQEYERELRKTPPTKHGGLVLGAQRLTELKYKIDELERELGVNRAGA